MRRIVDTTHKSSKVKYTGKWTRVTGDHKYAYTTKRDNSARLSTTGRQVLYVAPKTSASGFVQVFVDGNLVGRFDLTRTRRSTTGSSPRPPSRAAPRT